METALPAPRTAPRHWMRGLLVATVALIVVYCLGRSVAGDASALGLAARVADWRLLAVSGLASVAYRWLNAGVWAYVLAAVGQHVELGVATRMWLGSEACRWLPGSVWNLGSRVVLGRQHGIPTARVSMGIALELLLTVASWVAVALIGLMLCDARVLLPFDTRTVWLGTAGSVVVVAILLLLPGVSRRVGDRVQALAGRFRLLRQVRFHRGFACASILAYTFLGLLNGASCWLLVRAVAPEYDLPFGSVLAANALAWLAGFFAIFAPAGLGVREGTFVLLLSPWLPWESGVVAAGLWRLLQVAAELVCLGVILPSLTAGKAHDHTADTCFTAGTESSEVRT